MENTPHHLSVGPKGQRSPSANRQVVGRRTVHRVRLTDDDGCCCGAGHLEPSLLSRCPLACPRSRDIRSASEYRLSQLSLPRNVTPSHAWGRKVPGPLFEIGTPGCDDETLYVPMLTGSKIRPKRSEERRVGKEGRSRWSPYH